MAQTPEGRLKAVATRKGLTLTDYLAKIALGLKWCSNGKHWVSIKDFKSDKSRGDGLATICKDCNSVSGKWSPKKGRTLTEEHKRKIGAKHKGKIIAPWHIEAMRSANKGNIYRIGKKHTLETRKKMSESMRASDKRIRGEKHHSFKDGKSVERKDQRFTVEYKRWRYDVFIRDNFTCQKCGDNRGGNLVAHHIKPFSEYPELRFEVSNGLTVCKACHKEIHYG